MNVLEAAFFFGLTGTTFGVVMIRKLAHQAQQGGLPRLSDALTIASKAWIVAPVGYWLWYRSWIMEYTDLCM